MWNVSAPLALSREQEKVLQTWVAARNTPQKIVLRSRIVLLAAAGKANRSIARELRTSRTTVLLWRARFQQGGTAPLAEGAPGRGRKQEITPAQVQQSVQATLHTQPTAATHWRVATLAPAEWAMPASIPR